MPYDYLLEDWLEHKAEQLRHQLRRGSGGALGEGDDARVEQLGHGHHGGGAYVVHVGELDERNLHTKHEEGVGVRNGACTFFLYFFGKSVITCNSHHKS